MNKIFTLIVLSMCLISCKNKQAESLEKQPADRLATPETVALYNKLFRLMDKGIMLAHQDALAYGHDWFNVQDKSDVRDVVGDYPAVIGTELGHIEIGASHNLDSIAFADMKRYAKEAHARGGINTFSWHGDNIVTGNTAWDCAQDSVVRSVLPGGVHHEKYLVWLDRLGDFFLDLKDEEGRYIPLVFRMYHEHTGDWFWWCARQCTPDEYKALWRMTFDYLTNTKNIHHLLYAYSPSDLRDEAHFLERYPGDEYVDMVAFDTYVQAKTEEGLRQYVAAMDNNLSIITAYARKSGKIPAIGETGMEAIPCSTYFTEYLLPVISKYQVSWVLFWRNAWEKPDHFYAPYPGHSSAEDFVRFVEDPRILTNRDIVSED